MKVFLGDYWNITSCSEFSTSSFKKICNLYSQRLCGGCPLLSGRLEIPEKAAIEPVPYSAITGKAGTFILLGKEEPLW